MLHKKYIKFMAIEFDLWIKKKLKKAEKLYEKTQQWYFQFENLKFDFPHFTYNKKYKIKQTDLKRFFNWCGYDFLRFSVFYIKYRFFLLG